MPELPQTEFPADAPAVSGRLAILRALRHRNYRLFFGGQGISLVGTWMQNIALSWLIYRMTHSKMLLGLVGFSGQILTFLIAPFAGVLADRWRRHRLLVLTQTLSLIQASLLAALVLTNTIQVWHIIVLAAFLGMVNGFDIPIRQSFVVEMLERREDLPNAIALNSFIFNGARLIGPSIAGVLIFELGEGNCFLLNAVSYVAVIIALLLMRFKPAAAKPPVTRDILHSLKEGYQYTFGLPAIRAILLLLAFVSLVGFPYGTLMSAFAADELRGTSRTYGYIMSAVAVGALLGALYLANRKSTKGLDRVIGIAPMIFGLALMAFSLSRYLPLSLALLVFLGFGMMLQMASTNTLLQSMVDDDKRGRVMGFYTVSFIGTAPFGSLWIGAMARSIGTTRSLLIGGVMSVAAGAFYVSRLSRIRRLSAKV